MRFKIVSDSSSDLPALSGAVSYAMVPLKIIAGEKEFVDDSSLDVSQMVEYLLTYKGKSGTACPSVADWVDAFGDAERVICVTITSNLSGSCNAARLAKEDYETQYPDRKVHIVDSLSAGAELILIIEKAQELIEQGCDYETVCQTLDAYLQTTGLMFSLESLRNLANNGRVSPVTAKIAGVLGIRVVGRASDEGTLEQMDKCRGEKKALEKILERMIQQGYAGGKVRIDHCNNPGAARQLKEMILAKYQGADIAIAPTGGLCSFYAEQGGLLVGYEKA